MNISGLPLWLAIACLLNAGPARADEDMAARRAELKRGVPADKANNVVITDNDYK